MALNVGDKIRLETGRVIEKNVALVKMEYGITEDARDKKKYRGRVAIVTSIEESDNGSLKGKFFRINLDGGRNTWYIGDVMDSRKFKFQGRYVSTDSASHLLVINATYSSGSMLCLKEDGDTKVVFVDDIKSVEKAPRVKKIVREV